MSVIETITSDIVDLDQLNMTPILNDHGIVFERQQVIEDIGKHNPRLANTTCYYDSKGVLLGYFRFSLTEEGILIHSIQLRSRGSKAGSFRRLMMHAYSQLQQLNLPDTTRIYTWTNTRNEASIKLQERLGFKWNAGHRDAGKFATTKKDLSDQFRSLGIDMAYTGLKGNYPVRVLAHNLSATFVLHKPENAVKLERAVKEGKINPAIRYIISDEFGLIFADNDTRQICVHEQFLAFLWAFIYASWVINEEGVQRPVLRKGDAQFNGKIDDSKSVVQRAKELYIWAVSLPKQPSAWPVHLPSPEYFQTAEEQFYVERVNGIYLKAATYLLNHEAAHLINNHWDTLKELRRQPAADLTEEDRTLYVQVEQEADRFAMEEMIHDGDTENERFVTGLSIVLAHCASLFAISHPSGLAGAVHPDLDVRLFHSINFLQLKKPQNVDYIYLIAALTVNIFLGFNKTELEKIEVNISLSKSVEDPAEYFSECLHLIDKIKLAYES